jgi:hypothetical protein
MARAALKQANADTRSSGLAAVGSRKSTLYVIKTEEINIIYDPEHNHFFNLNRTGLEIWNQLVDGKSEAEVTHKMARDYGVDPMLVREDIRQLVTDLARQQVASNAVVLIDAPQPEATESDRQLAFPNPSAENAKPTLRNLVDAYIGLLLFDLFIHCRPFKALCTRIATWPVAAHSRHVEESIQQLCVAVTRACIWYPKRAVCLQRSAVTTCLLRNYGIPAKLVIGVRPVPFVAHAWVEVHGAVVNDSPKIRNFYRTLTSY